MTLKDLEAKRAKQKAAESGEQVDIDAAVQAELEAKAETEANQIIASDLVEAQDTIKDLEAENLAAEAKITELEGKLLEATAEKEALTIKLGELEAKLAEEEQAEALQTAEAFIKKHIESIEGFQGYLEVFNSDGSYEKKLLEAYQKAETSEEAEAAVTSITSEDKEKYTKLVKNANQKAGKMNDFTFDSLTNPKNSTTSEKTESMDFSFFGGKN